MYGSFGIDVGLFFVDIQGSFVDMLEGYLVDIHGALDICLGLLCYLISLCKDFLLTLYTCTHKHTYKYTKQ